jgi:hypothetical protein
MGGYEGLVGAIAMIDAATDALDTLDGCEEFSREMTDIRNRLNDRRLDVLKAISGGKNRMYSAHDLANKVA